MDPAEPVVATQAPYDHLPRSGSWQVAAGQKRGTSHEATGAVCQDAYRVAMPSPEMLVIAVADGAGCAAAALTGATVAANAGIEQLCTRLGKDGAMFDDPTLTEILREGLTTALEAIETEAGNRRLLVHDLATTLILVVASPELIAVAQVGDGAIVISDSHGQMRSLTCPPVGEYINETTFITSEDGLRTAQTNVWRGRAAQLAAFSDGLQLLCLSWPDCRPHKAFFAPLFRFIELTTDALKAGQELGRFLSSARLGELTDDDLTLVLASLTEGSK